jgi:hypothetical protein
MVGATSIGSFVMSTLASFRNCSCIPLKERTADLYFDPLRFIARRLKRR